jgi:ubiquitin C-terminal hydrolase
LKEEKRVLACKTTSFHYSLFALMIHEGTAQSGHYYIIIKNNSKWWKFSDRHVSNISE